MAWYFDKGYSYYGPGFGAVDVPAVRSPISFSGVGSCTSVDPSAVPTTWRQRAPHKHGIGDITLVGGSIAVTRRFKDLVERFEPDRHVFVPISLERHNGTPIDGEWFFFAVQQDVDCILTDVDEEPRFMEAANGRPRYSMGGVTPTSSRNFHLSKPRIEGRHLWTGGILGMDCVFVSDEFAAAYRKEKFRSVLSLYKKLNLVDREWVAEEQMGPMLEKWQRFQDSGRSDRSIW